MEYNFKVKTIEAGQRNSYGDSFYHYEVESDRPEWEIKMFCTRFLKTSYPKKEMPNPFSGELLEFTKISDGKYKYRVRTEFTG